MNSQYALLRLYKLLTIFGEQETSVERPIGWTGCSKDVACMLPLLEWAFQFSGLGICDSLVNN